MTANPQSRWAEQLSVPADVARETAAAAFLRALPGDDFLPPAERVAAVNALAGTGLPTIPDPTAEQILREEVNAFAKAYWTLEPAERKTAWAELSRRGANEARLRELQPGLEAITKPLDVPVAEELAALMREFFVLPPRERAIRRNFWLAAHAAEEDKWREAFATVQKELPGLAALDVPLFTMLSQLGALASVGKVASEALPRKRLSSEESVADFARVRRDRRGQDRDADGNSNTYKWLPGISFFVLVGICALNGIVKNVGRYHPESNPIPRFSTARDLPAYTPVATYEFSAAEVEKFEQYERDWDAGRRAPAPPNYATWIRLNRPPGVRDAKPNSPFVYTIPLDRPTIQACREYDRTRRGVKPEFYEIWVEVGKPTEPGNYPFPGSVPKP